jgi:hypothetical protein
MAWRIATGLLHLLSSNYGSRLDSRQCPIFGGRDFRTFLIMALPLAIQQCYGLHIAGGVTTITVASGGGLSEPRCWLPALRLR